MAGKDGRWSELMGFRRESLVDWASISLVGHMFLGPKLKWAPHGV